MTRAAGLPRYEVSNHARPGAESRHNLTYWRSGDYAGIGPGAHGRRGGVATARHKKPENWLAATTRNGHGTQVEEPLSADQRASEALVMGLRMTEGLTVDPARVGLDAVDALAGHGLLRRDGLHVATTEAGILLLDSILPAIARD